MRLSLLAVQTTHSLLRMDPSGLWPLRQQVLPEVIRLPLTAEEPTFAFETIETYGVLAPMLWDLSW